MYLKLAAPGAALPTAICEPVSSLPVMLFREFQTRPNLNIFAITASLSIGYTAGNKCVASGASENAGRENAGQNIFDFKPLIYVYFTGF